MRRILALAIVGVMLAVIPVAAGEPSGFRQGVGSGEMTSDSAVLWTRTSHSPVAVQVSGTKTFQTLVAKAKVETSSAEDQTVHYRVTGLAPNHRYYFRFRDPSTKTFSRVGTFKTAPAPDQDVNVHFAWSGDSDGWTKPSGSPAFNRFEVLDAAASSGAKFFVYLGDTIYSDSSFSPFSPPGASTLDQYRKSYRQNLRYSALRNVMARMGIYANWDDHEVRNDFDMATVDPALFAAGKQAFQEYMAGATWDPEVGFYRTFQWGKGVQFFILDQRSFRDAEVAHFPTAPGETSACDNPPGSGNPDLAPMLPPTLRIKYALILPQFALSPPPQCIAALQDPTRSMLGAAQKARFEQDLAASTARFKVVFTGDPIQNEYVVPYDRWEGYLGERSELLNFITSNDIGGVVWLATDQHDNVTNDVWTDLLGFGGTDTGTDEAIVGPIATNTFEKEIGEIFGSPTLGTAFVSFLTDNLGAECADIDTYAWGDVMYDAKARTLTIEQKDANGHAVCPPLVLH